MVLITLNRIIRDKDGSNSEGPFVVNPDQIAMMVPNKDGTSLALRGFHSSFIVSQSIKEIENAIRTKKLEEFEERCWSVIDMLGGDDFVARVNAALCPPSIFRP